MAATQQDMNHQGPIRSTIGGLVHSRIRATLTTAGAVLTTSATVSSDPGITLTKTGTTGAYALVYPISPVDVTIDPTIISAAATIGQMTITAQSASAGTATLLFSAPNGTAAYGASGDIIILDMWGATQAVV